ncbi:MAG: hypothetical protein MJ211_15935 [Bacteroidales bacterium]|nr:hypothetical protein [Bacteroidales bacterium]
MEDNNLNELISLIIRIIFLGGVYITFAICAAVIVGAVVILIKEKLYDKKSRKEL